MANYNYTPKYKIPYIQGGSRINVVEETTAALTIENQLYGLIKTHSGGHGVIDVGTFTSNFAAGNSSVYLAATGSDPALEGFINQVFVREFETLTWTGLPDNSLVYLYAELIEEDAQSSRVRGDVIADWNITGNIPDDAILVATATTTAVDITLDTDPPTRYNIGTLADHIATSDNPHANPFYQDNIVTSGITVYGDANIHSMIAYGNLTVLGALTFEEGLHVFGETEFHNSVTVSGISYFLGSSLFSGIANFHESVYFNNISATGGLRMYSNMWHYGDIYMGSGNTIDGRDLSVDGQTLDNHISNLDNPHQVTIDQVSGIPLWGSRDGAILQGDLEVASGITIDEVDLSETKFLFEGNNADPITSNGVLIKNGHTHNMSGIEYDYISNYPEYADTITSGIGRGRLYAERYQDQNIYSWEAGNQAVPYSGIQPITLVTEYGIPGDCDYFSGLSIDIVAPYTTIDVELYDSNNNQVQLIGGSKLTSTGDTVEEKDITIINPLAYNWDEGNFATVMITMNGFSGLNCKLGKSQITYRTEYPVS